MHIHESEAKMMYDGDAVSQKSLYFMSVVMKSETINHTFDTIIHVRLITCLILEQVEFQCKTFIDADVGQFQYHALHHFRLESIILILYELQNLIRQHARFCLHTQYYAKEYNKMGTCYSNLGNGY